MVGTSMVKQELRPRYTIHDANRLVRGPSSLYAICTACSYPSLIISPVFFSAFNYTLLGKAVEKINPTYCMLTSKMVSPLIHPVQAKVLIEV